ncbi:hypothetical protein BVX98_06845 [bacterium F11]|nr:hypothetical protein BVX98_06845 [bacterium F11]
MKKVHLQSERGAVLTILVAGILLIILAATYFTGLSAKASRCKNALETIEFWNIQWQASKAGSSPDVGICNQMNVLIGKYNRSCGKSYGNLPLETCG